MKTLRLILLFLIFSITANSQIVFEQGYFINNNGEKIICLINNIDWKNNPSSFEYKLSESAESKETDISEVREFEINGQLKYIRFTVHIDRSSTKLSQLSNTRSPEFSEEQLYLKVLLEGKANLYMYSSENVIRYFFSDDNTEIEQLIYKRFIVISDNRYDAEDKIHQNLGYQQQLINNIICEAVTRNMILTTGYKKKELVKLLVKYNESTQSLIRNYTETESSGIFKFGIAAGVNRSSFKAYSSVSPTRNTDYGSVVNFRIGGEIEYVLPFQKNKWSISIEPHFQYYNSSVVSGVYTKITDYKTIDLPFGIRHYLFLSDKSKLFFSGSLVFNYSIASKVYVEYRQELEIINTINLKFGVGYCYDRMSVELEYNANRNLLGKYTSWSSDYQTISMVFGYTLFDGGK